MSRALRCRLPLTPVLQASLIRETHIYVKVEHNFDEIRSFRLAVLGHHSYLLLTSQYVIRKFLDRDY